jgi:hypothetical protein
MVSSLCCLHAMNGRSVSRCRHLSRTLAPTTPSRVRSAWSLVHADQARDIPRFDHFRSVLFFMSSTVDRIRFSSSACNVHVLHAALRVARINLITHFFTTLLRCTSNVHFTQDCDICLFIHLPAIFKRVLLCLLRWAVFAVQEAKLSVNVTKSSCLFTSPTSAWRS